MNILKSENKIFAKDNYVYLGAAFIGVMAFIFFSSFAFVIIFSLVFYLFSEIWGRKVVLFVSAAALLTLTSTINENLRLAVQVVIPLLLGFNFFKKYGFEFAKYPQIPKPVLQLIALLYAALIISTLFSDYFLLGMQQTFRQSVFFVIVYFIYSLIEDKTDIKILLAAMAFAGVVYVINLFSYFYENNMSLIQTGAEQFTKLQTGYLNTNSIASFFLIIFSLVLAFLFMKNSNTAKLLLWGGMTLAILTFAIANSRAAFLSMLVSIIFIFAILNKKLLFRVGAVIIAATFAVLIIEPLYNFVEIYFRLESVATGRDFILESVWNVIKSNFLLGHGPAGTKQVMYSNLPFMLGSPEEHFIYVHWSIIDFGHAHNFYLFFLSDMGILGFLVSLLLPIIFISMGMRIIKKSKNADNFYYFLVIGILGAGISLFIRGLFEWSNLISYGTLANDLPFWTIFAMLMFISKIDFSSNFRRVF